MVLKASGTRLTVSAFLFLWYPVFALDCSSTCNLSSVSFIQIGNHRCDLECNTPICNFDSDSDGISDCIQVCQETGCDVALLGNGLCDPLCQSAECGFDHGDCDCAPGCSPDLQFNSHCDEVCAVPACNFDSFLCVRAIQGSCAVGCFPSMLQNGVCEEMCNNEACGYDGGDCGCDSDCIKVRSLQSGVDNSTEQNPTVIYVSATENVTGDGSYEQPYSYLNTALGNARDAYTTIYLLGSEVSADISHSSPGTQANDPIANVYFKRLLISSLLCALTPLPSCSNAPTVINFRDRLLITCSGNVVFTNVQITAAGFFDSIVLKYCPYLQVKGNITYDDRGKPATVEMVAANAVCKTTACNFSFFIVEEQGSLTLINVDIIDFTVQQTSVILLQGGNAILQNVTFTNIQSCMSGAESGVILKNNTRAVGSFEFIGGSVSLLNNGYEYGSGLQFSPFLYLKNLPFPVLLQVTFTYNNVLTLISTPQSLLYFEGMTTGLMISECSFLSNVVTGALISVLSPMDVKYAYKVILNSLSFLNNFGQMSLIELQYEGTPQSTQLINCTFTSNSVPSGDLIDAEVLIPTYTTLGSSPPFLIYNLTLLRNTNFQHLLSLLNFDLIEVTASNLWLNGDSIDVSEPSPLQTYLSYSQVYMTLPNVVEIAGCSGLLYIDTAFAVQVTSLDLRNNTCLTGLTGFVFKDVIAAIEIKGSFLSGNTGKLIYPYQSSGLIILGTVVNRNFTTLSSLICVFERNNGNSVSLSEGNWLDVNSSFSFSLGSAVALNNVKATFIGTSFYSNTSPDNGGGLFLSGFANLTCINCSFRNNSAKLGGGLYIEHYCISNCISCEFTGNLATIRGAAVFIYMSPFTSSVFLNSTFRENVSYDDGTISTVGGNLTVLNSTFTENRSLLCPGISIVLGSMIVINSHFYAQTGVPSAFLYLGTSSFGLVENSDFSSATGCGIFAFTSYVHVTNCSFQGLRSDRGGLIYAMEMSNIYLISVFARNMGGLIYLIDSNLKVQESIFKDFSPFGVYGTGFGEVSINGSSFKDGWGSVGGAVFLQGNNVTIRSSQFSNNTALEGGAVFLQSNYVVILSSRFDNNTGELGGAVYIQGATGFSAEVTQSHFRNNSAGSGGAIYATNVFFYETRSEFDYNQATYGGGAVYLDSDTLSVINDATMKYNRALYGGGVIWTVSQPVFSGKNSFEENAAFYGSDIASFPIRLEFAPILNWTSQISPESITIYDIPPGQVLSLVLTVYVKDHQNQTYNPDSSSVAYIMSRNDTLAMISGISKVIAVNGTYTFSQLKVDTDPGSTGMFVLNTSYADLPGMNIIFQTRKCVPGEQREHNACTPCVLGTYGFDPSALCQKCPSTATCFGGTSLAPNKGYWRPANDSDQILPCPNYEACLEPPENPPNNYTGNCSEGYQGRECQSCVEGYSHSSTNVCEQCPDMVYNVLRIVGSGLLVLVIIVVIVVCVLLTANKRSAKELIFCKILINFVQLVSPVFNYTADWPSLIRAPFTAESTFGVASGQFLSIDCLIANVGTLQDYYFTKMFIVSLIPIVLTLSATLIWSLIAIKNRAIFSRGLVGTFVVVYFIVLSMLMKELFSALSCVEVYGDFWLTVDLDIPCMRSDVTALVVPSIIIWGLAVPLSCFIYLYINRGKLQEESFLLKFGFLTSDYKDEKHYWEFFLLIRKCSIAFFSGFYMVSSLTQALAVQLTLFVFLGCQYKYHPYYHPETNSMELYSLLVANISVFCCLFYLTSDVSYAFAWVLFVVGFLANVVFLAYWIREMRAVLYAILAWVNRRTARWSRINNCFRQSEEPAQEIPESDPYRCEDNEDNTPSLSPSDHRNSDSPPLKLFRYPSKTDSEKSVEVSD